MSFESNGFFFQIKKNQLWIKMNEKKKVIFFLKGEFKGIVAGCPSQKHSSQLHILVGFRRNLFLHH